jgi:hypothetical protein
LVFKLKIQGRNAGVDTINMQSLYRFVGEYSGDIFWDVTPAVSSYNLMKMAAV